MNNLKFLLQYVLKAKKTISAGVLFTILMSITELFPGVIFKVITDSLANLTNDSSSLKLRIKVPLKAFNTKIKILKSNLDSKEEIFTAIIYLSITLLLIYIVINIFWYLRDVYFNSAVERIVYNFKKDIYSRIAYLKTSEFRKNRTGSFISRITYDVAILNQIIDILVELTRSSIALIIFLPVLFYIDIKITLFALLFYPISYLFIKHFSYKLKGVSKEITDNVATYTDFLEEKINRFESIKLNNQESSEVKKFHTLVKENLLLNLKRIRIKFFLKPSNEVMAFVGISIICIYFGYTLLYGEIEPGTVVFYLITLKAAYKPFKKAAKAIGDLHISLVSVEKIINLLNLKFEKSEESSKLGEIESIKFDNIGFKHEGMDRYLFKDFTQLFQKGRKYGISGISGVGKSTLVNLIPQLFEVETGSIVYSVDGKEIGLNPTQIRGKVSLLNRNYRPFNGSFLDNILYGSEGEFESFENSKIDRLARELFYFSSINYDTIIGKDGVHLSDGQIMKLQILNSLIKKPDIIIFDEIFELLDRDDVNRIMDWISEINIVIVVSRDRELMSRMDEVVKLG